MNNSKNTIIGLSQKELNRLIKKNGESGKIMLDEETGEIAKIPNGSSMKFHEDNEPTDEKKSFRQENSERKRFVKLFLLPIDELTKVLTYAEFTTLIKLTQYIDMKNCVFGLDRGENKFYYKQSDLARLIDMKPKKFSPIFNKYINLGIVIKVKRTSPKTSYKEITAYCLNPHIFLNGSNPTFEMANNSEFVDDFQPLEEGQSEANKKPEYRQLWSKIGLNSPLENEIREANQDIYDNPEYLYSKDLKKRDEDKQLKK